MTVHIEALDPPGGGRFRAEALGWTAHSAGGTTYLGPAGGLGRPEPGFLGLALVPVTEAKTGTTNRLRRPGPS